MAERTVFYEPESLRMAGWFAGEITPPPVRLDFRPVLELLSGLSDYELDDWWIEFNRANKDVIGNLEINSEGALLISPSRGGTGRRPRAISALPLPNGLKVMAARRAGSILASACPTVHATRRMSVGFLRSRWRPTNHRSTIYCCSVRNSWRKFAPTLTTCGYCDSKWGVHRQRRATGLAD